MTEIRENVCVRVSGVCAGATSKSLAAACPTLWPSCASAKMKLLSQKGDPFTVGTPGPGEVKLVPEDAEDLWHTYNILVAGDTLTATAIRKVQKESSTGSVDSQRVKVKLAVQIQRVDFDPEGGELRLSGRVTNEVEGVRLVSI